MNQFSNKTVEQVIIEELAVGSAKNLHDLIDVIKDQVKEGWLKNMQTQKEFFLDNLVQENFRSKSAGSMVKFLINQIVDGQSDDRSKSIAIKLFFLEVALDTLRIQRNGKMKIETSPNPSFMEPLINSQVNQSIPNGDKQEHQMHDSFASQHDKAIHGLESRSARKPMSVHVWAVLILLGIGIIFHLIANPEHYIPSDWFTLGITLFRVLLPLAFCIPFLVVSFVVYLFKRRFWFGAYYTGAIISILFFGFSQFGNFLYNRDQVKKPDNYQRSSTELTNVKPNGYDSAYNPAKIGLLKTDAGKLTMSEFAAQIKTKYPEYKDIDDSLLVKKVLEKYPVYSDWLESPLKGTDSELQMQSSPNTIPYSNQWISFRFPKTWKLSRKDIADVRELYNLIMVNTGSNNVINFSINGCRNSDKRLTLDEIDRIYKSNTVNDLKKKNVLHIDFISRADGSFQGFPTIFSHYSLSDLKEYNLSGEMIIFRTDQQIVIIRVEVERGVMRSEEINSVLESLKFTM